MSIEEIEIEGYVGKNPIYSSANFPDMLTFSVGVSQSSKNKDTDEWESKTTWYNAASFNKEKSAYLFSKIRRGDKVVVKGKPSARAWIDKEGEAKCSISITISKIALMKKNDDEDSEPNHDSSGSYIAANTPLAIGIEEFNDNQEQVVTGRVKLSAKPPMTTAPIYDDEIPF